MEIPGWSKHILKPLPPPPTMKKKNVLKPMPRPPITKKKFQNKYHQLLLPPHEDEKKINVMTDEQKNFIVNVYF